MNNELSMKMTSETSQEAQESPNNSLPYLPDTFSEKTLLERFKGIEREVASELPDVETKEGRKRIKALAAKISKSKMALDTPIRDYLRILKAQPKVLEASARNSKARFEELRDKVLEPLAVAQKSQDDQLAWLDGIPEWCASSPLAADISETLAQVEAFDWSIVWPELEKKFKVSHETALTTLKVTLERVRLAEKQAAELEELRRQMVAAERAERDRKIAEMAAEKARLAAEEKAQKDREDVDRRAAEARQREKIAEAAAEKAIRDAEMAEERRAQEAEAAKQREAQAKIDAEASAQRQAEAAAAAERKAIADEEDRQKREAQQRENDKKHRTTVNRRNLAVLLAMGISEDDGKKVITAIAKGELPDIKIHY